MSDTTPRLGLPWLMPAQAQKHVTVNESLGRLDALIQCAVTSRTVTVQPSNPGDGDAWILPAGATGADWDGFAEHDIAYFQDGAWFRIAARAGLTAWVGDEAALVMFHGTAWSAFADAITALANLTELGVGTEADVANPFSAKLNSALWTARYDGEGGTGDLRYTLNKEGAGDTLSMLFQSGWSGRAEIGLAGDDDLSVNVSGDGAAWTQALRVEHATGRVRIPRAVIGVEAVNEGALGGFRNLLINGCSRIWQRGPSITAASGYAADMHWIFKVATGDLTLSRRDLDGSEGIDGAPRFAVRIDPTALSAGHIYRMTWRTGCDALRASAGRRCLFSFWAKASEPVSADVLVIQRFGSGGSSPLVLRVPGVDLTTAWTRHTVAFDAPSLAGKTVGAGASVEAAVERAGLSFSETIDFANAQFEAGAPGQTFASRFEYRDEAVELALCRRYFERKSVRTEDGSRHVPLAPKRAIPSITVSAGSPGHITTDGFELTHTSAATCILDASAEL